MKLTLFTLALVSATAQACTPGLYGVGTCAPPVTASGNGDFVTPHIIHALGKCFKDKFGVGPWTFHGLASPDYSGVGNAWGVYKDFGDGVRSRYHHVLLSSKTNERLLRNISSSTSATYARASKVWTPISCRTWSARQSRVAMKRSNNAAQLTLPIAQRPALREDMRHRACMLRFSHVTDFRAPRPGLRSGKLVRGYQAPRRG